MIRKNPMYDLSNPPGQRVYPIAAERLSDVIEGVVRRSSEPAVKSNKEVFDEGYAAGWLDCQAQQRQWQERNKG